MTALREIAARLGFDVDPAGFKEAERLIGGVKAKLRGLDTPLKFDRSAASAGTAAAAAARKGGEAAAKAATPKGTTLPSLLPPPAPHGLPLPPAVAAPTPYGQRGRAAAGTGVPTLPMKLGHAGASAQAAATKGLRQGKTAAQEAELAAKKAGQAAEGASGLLGTLGKLAATVGISHFLMRIIELGSDANETTSALGALFGPQGVGEVEKWSGAMAKELGRSKYDLQAYTARLGAVIEPMMGSKEKAQEMSTSLSGLAVDMASFFNASDEDAMHALRSGLTGEYESLKKFGVVMNDATLTEFGHTQGMKKKITAMTIAEKTQLRYNFILAKTKTAQGDAKRTGDGYANSTKNLAGQLKTLGIDAARSILPAIEKVTIWARDGLNWFNELRQGTFALEASMGTLAAIAGTLAYSLVAPFIPMALAIGGLILVVDELYNLFTGGDSMLGRTLDTMFGDGTADTIVRTLRDTTRELFDLWDELPDAQASWQLLEGAIDDVGFAIDALFEKMVGLVTGPLSWFKDMDLNFSEKLYKGLHLNTSLKEVQAERARREGQGMGRVATRGLEGDPTAVTTARGKLGLTREERTERIYAGVQERKAQRQKNRDERDAAIARAKPREDEGLGMSVDPSLEPAAAVDPDKLEHGRARASSVDWSLRARAPEPSAPPMSSAAGTANMSVNVGPTIVTINSNNPAEVRRITKETMEAERRKTMAALAAAGGR